MADKVFVEGLRTFKKNDNAPDFVLGDIIIEPNTLFAWLKGEGKQYLTTYKETKQLRLQVTRSRDGGLTVAVNTFVPSQQTDKQKPSNNFDDGGNLPF